MTEEKIVSAEEEDFQNTEEVNFEDNTKVELIGRFVGGPVEGQKPIGFSISKNNVGQAEIQLKLQNPNATKM